MNEPIDFDKLPTIQQELIDSLKRVYVDSVVNVSSYEEMLLIKGQQQVISYLDTIRMHQQSTGE
jgi:hypothetical protein